MPRLSIITPTICRSSLERLCQSIDSQTDQDFEHIVMVDVPYESLSQAQAIELDKLRLHPKREIHICSESHKNCGNTCRHNACQFAKGDYIFYIDDDDYFADRDVFRTLRGVDKEWAIFPMMLNGQRFLSVPPQGCQISTGNFMHRRGFAEWPDIPNYESDWAIVSDMMQKAPYQFLNCRPLVIHPQHNRGEYF